MSDDRDIRIFEIIYNKCSNKPMSFIKKEVIEAQKALLDANEELKNYQPSAGFDEDGAFIVTEEEKVPCQLTRDDLMLKKPKEIRESIGKEWITCCICGKNFKTLGAHLKRTHNISAEEYLKICGLPEDTVLMSQDHYLQTQENIRNAYETRTKKRDEEPAAADFDPDIEVEMESEQSNDDDGFFEAEVTPSAEPAAAQPE